ncbi:DUF1109 domain-containing protein [Qipengyuania sp. YG27]|uniref:DUF1109 domain-containing protein n=1 Tax=Qipengyuania mesophila TaxID=2867246 RepID=A0ABS7JVC5_9SPHN|nr:DUF1109 domain-containing protein [Qipengyuania mesophila]MBX7501604.1 DUF1109 domain-containing protein [Qipengyuania mesophila]
MNRVPHSLIDELAADLAPVRPLRRARGIALVATATLVAVVLVEVIDGFWRGIATGQASPLFFIANGMFAMLGTAAALAAIRMASPQVGNSHEGTRWALAMAALLPVAALVVLGLQGDLGQVAHDPYGFGCLIAGIEFGGLTFVALIVWLRRGAPVSPPLAGTLTGIAAGSLGTFAHGLACPVDTLAHLGSWHVLPVVLGGVIGRITVPPLVRW